MSRGNLKAFRFDLIYLMLAQHWVHKTNQATEIPKASVARTKNKQDDLYLTFGSTLGSWKDDLVDLIAPFFSSIFSL